MNRIIPPSASSTSFKHRFQAVFKLAAILRSGDHRAQIQRDDSLPLERFRHIACDNALRQTFHDRGLTNTRFANKNRIVFRSPGKDLNNAPDFFVATDHRIELSFARQFREIPRVSLQRLILSFRILIGDLLRAANRNQNLQNCIFGYTVCVAAARATFSPFALLNAIKRCSVLTYSSLN